MVVAHLAQASHDVLVGGDAARDDECPLRAVEGVPLGEELQAGVDLLAEVRCDGVLKLRVTPC